MITIKTNEQKELLFDVLVEGIDSKLLNFMFRVEINNIEYGFPCINEKGKLKVKIPKLDKIINECKTGIYKGKLEGIGDDKYYTKPWQDMVELKIEPKVEVKPEETTINEDKNKDLQVKAYFTGEQEQVKEIIHEEVKKVETKQKSKNSFLRNKLK
jgi:hypothetical protein